MRWSRGTRGTRLAVMLIALGVSGCDRNDDRPNHGRAADEDTVLDPRLLSGLPAGVTHAVAREGRTLFITNCAACHAPDGSGTQLGPSLRDTVWLHLPSAPPADSIAALVRRGVAEPIDGGVPMPPREGDLTDAELRALAAYTYALRATGPGDPNPAP